MADEKPTTEATTTETREEKAAPEATTTAATPEATTTAATGAGPEGGPVPGDPSSEPVATAEQSHVAGRVGPPTIAQDSDAPWHAPEGVEQVAPGTVLDAAYPRQGGLAPESLPAAVVVAAAAEESAEPTTTTSGASSPESASPPEEPPTSSTEPGSADATGPADPATSRGSASKSKG